MPLASLPRRIAICAIASIGFVPAQANAGPLLDWLFGRYRAAPAYAVGQPVPIGNGTVAGYGNYGAGYGTNGTGYAANYGTYYGSQLPVIGPAGAGYRTPAASGITAATLPPTLSYVPNFRTNSYRAPVTYYRPLLTTDPNTGGQAVAMAPCTSYEYQTQRVPAFGRSALYGSNLLPQIRPAPQSLPTYRLPSGGIPLAYSGSAAPYTSGYGGYSALQPPAGLPQAAANGAYPTAPLGAAPYYGGAPAGGSCGNYVAPAPGLVAPQAPARTITPAPGYGQPTTPPTRELFPGTAPGTAPSTTPAPGIFPNPAGTDPADSRPSLSALPRGNSRSGELRPELRAIVRQPAPMDSSISSTPASSYDERRETGYFESEKRDVPRMSPIPVPDGFKFERRWNPGLLDEEDKTALRPVSPSVAQFAGQSKQIHWASFEDRPSSRRPPASSNGLRPTTGLRPATGLRNMEAHSVRRPPAAAPTRHNYDTTGWKASR